MAIGIWILVTVLATVVITEVVWRIPPGVAVLGFLVLPVLALPLWVARSSDASTFTFVKIYSVALGAAYVHALEITTWVDRPAGRLLAFLLLAGNILEASVAERAQGGYANALAGLLLILVQASPATFRVEPRAPGKDLVYPLGACGSRAIPSGTSPSSTGATATGRSVPLPASRSFTCWGRCWPCGGGAISSSSPAPSG